MPAYCASHEMSAPAASRRRTVALLIDGPIPSPEISVTGVDMWSVGVRWSGRGNQVAEMSGQAREDDGRERCGRRATNLSDPAHLAQPSVEQHEAEDGNSLTSP